MFARHLSTFLLAAIALGGGRLSSAPVRVDHVTADLVSEVSSIQPGHRFWVALHLKMDPHWHTYWKVAGDSGLATSIQWTLPEGFKAGEIVWPYPERIDVSGLISHAFENEAVLLVPIDPPSDLKAGTRVVLQAMVDWLVCEEICIPGSAKLQIPLPVTAGAKPNAPAAPLFAQARTRVPMPAGNLKVSGEKNGNQVKLRVRAPAGQVLPEHLYFFADEENRIEYAALQPLVFPSEGEAELTLTLSPLAGGAETLTGVLVGNTAFGFVEGSPRAVQVRVPLDAAVLPPPNRSVPRVSFGLLGLAFLGGLILNLMPCVFPVLGLKILGFAQQAGQDRAKIAAHGAVFSAGVLVSFWILAGLLIFLRAKGADLGWGFQLQKAGFVAAMAMLLFAFALSLGGLFEFGASLTRAGQLTAGKRGVLGSFFSGVLATVVATPCAAPFLAPALGAALALPAFQSLLTFTFIGLGLAFPYLVLSLKPGLLKFLPRPGAWMENFKKGMAFLLFATTAYLVWVLAGQVSEDGLLKFLFGLVFVAFGLWLYGAFCQPSAAPQMRRGMGVLAGLFLAGGLWLAWPMEKGGEFPKWEPWSPARVVELRMEGRPIYVDFTARWCATCQTNKKVVFASSEIRKRFEELGVATLKADWTLQDPEITKELARHGRSAVPFNLVYLPGKEEPVVLPELLAPGTVLDVFEPLREGQ